MEEEIGNTTESNPVNAERRCSLALPARVQSVVLNDALVQARR
jgi:hypothetical protein